MNLIRKKCLLLCIPIILLQACVKVLDFDIPDDEKNIVINSLFSEGKPFNVYINNFFSKY